jgi:hypothetical protein
MDKLTSLPTTITVVNTTTFHILNITCTPLCRLFQFTPRRGMHLANFNRVKMRVYHIVENYDNLFEKLDDCC